MPIDPTGSQRLLGPVVRHEAPERQGPSDNPDSPESLGRKAAPVTLLIGRQSRRSTNRPIDPPHRADDAEEQRDAPDEHGESAEDRQERLPHRLQGGDWIEG